MKRYDLNFALRHYCPKEETGVYLTVINLRNLFGRLLSAFLCGAGLSIAMDKVQFKFCSLGSVKIIFIEI